MLPVYHRQLEIRQIQLSAVLGRWLLFLFSHHLGTSVLHAHLCDHWNSVTTCSEKNIHYIPRRIGGAGLETARNRAKRTVVTLPTALQIEWLVIYSCPPFWPKFVLPDDTQLIRGDRNGSIRGNFVV